MKLVGNWSYPTAIKFGAGRISELPAACQQAGISRPLFVTDKGLAGLPITAAALELLDAAGLGKALFSEVDPNPNEKNVAAGLRAYTSGDHDGVIAFGGGSALDLGKAVAFMSGQSRPLWDFEDIGDWWSRADPAGIAPVVAVPTTAGTGSEVGRASVITNSISHVKKIIFHPKMLPVVVLTAQALAGDLSSKNHQLFDREQAGATAHQFLDLGLKQTATFGGQLDVALGMDLGGEMEAGLLHPLGQHLTQNLEVEGDMPIELRVRLGQPLGEGLQLTRQIDRIGRVAQRLRLRPPCPSPPLPRRNPTVPPRSPRPGCSG